MFSFKIPYWPSTQDPDIREKICRKKEFYAIYQLMVELAQKGINSVDHTDDTYRSFLAAFMAPHTPYDRCLVIHGVGTGKTGCAIKIVEQYRSVYKKAVILNKSDTPTENFKGLLANELYSKYSTDAERKRMSMFYEFDTYHKFSKKILKMSKDKQKEMFESVIFILDEIHNIVTKTYDADDTTYDILLELFDSLRSCTVVGLTATPMRDSYDEIIPLVNMFIKNPNNRIPKDCRDLKIVKRYLRQVSKYCVSWYFKDFTFKINEVGEKPLRLHHTIVPLIMGEIQKCTFDQSKIREEYNKKDKASSKKSFMEKDKVYASLASFPSIGFEVDALVVKKLEQYDKVSSKSGKKNATVDNYRFQFKNVSYRDDMLNNLHKYSAKFAYMLEVIEDDPDYYTNPVLKKGLIGSGILCEGLVYVFCENIANTGIKTIIAMFQEFGYEYYTGGDINNIEKNPKRFTVYVGDARICPNKEERFNLFTDPRNINGEYCKIIVASNVMKESVSLKAIRKVFILTPHWNYSSIIQAQGRALRKDSYVDLPFDKRTVDLYRLVCIRSRQGYKAVCKKYKKHMDINEEKEFKSAVKDESIDLYKCYKSSIKQYKMDAVSRVMEKNAMDYFVVNNLSKMPKYDSFDTSTYLRYDSENVSLITSIMYDELIQGPRSIVDIINTITTSHDISPTMVIQYITNIVERKVGIHKDKKTPKFFQIKNDTLFLSNSQESKDFFIMQEHLDIASKIPYIDSYIDRSEHVAENFPWDITPKEFCNDIDLYKDYGLYITEHAVALSLDSSSTRELVNHCLNVVDMLHYLIHKICGKYYHVVDRRRIAAAAYANASTSIANGVLVKVFDESSHTWLHVDTVDTIHYGNRIRSIQAFIILKLIIKHCNFATISLNDGVLRLLDYITIRLSKKQVASYLSICDEWIDKFKSQDIITDVDIKQALEVEKDIKSKIVCNLHKDRIGDRRNDFRGHDINTHMTEAVVQSAMFIIVKALDKKSRRELFNGLKDARFFIKDEYWEPKDILLKNLDVEQTPQYVKDLVRDYPKYESYILMTYFDLRSRKAKNIKAYLRDLIIEHNLFVFI
ncbi:AAA family ATPase [Candidatus Dojkabacteria bacterium]|uniref:AAA family ATPase n=1 Tax=Candidatus Dojkabacteria bacterium TaxID=2099670 RepID=A0A5C7J4J0_9BACT|nr:MAG: AAA family ATPase [Candidatus Dojkabacteria bacterium]